MFEIFVEYLDGIYWEGYTLELAISNPEAFRFELKQFKKNYKIR